MTMERLHELLRPYGTYDAAGPDDLRAVLMGRAGSAADEAVPAPA
jgi:hypothetical protein